MQVNRKLNDNNDNNKAYNLIVMLNDIIFNNKLLSSC